MLLYPMDLDKIPSWWKATSVMFDWAAEHSYPWRPLGSSFPEDAISLWSRESEIASGFWPMVMTLERQATGFFWVDRVAQFLLCARQEHEIKSIALEVLRGSPMLTLSSVLAKPKGEIQSKRGRIRRVPTLLPPPGAEQFHTRMDPQYVRMLPESDIDGLRLSFREPIATFRESIDVLHGDSIATTREGSYARFTVSASFPENGRQRLEKAERALEKVPPPANMVEVLWQNSEPSSQGRILHRRSYRFLAGTRSFLPYLRRVERTLLLAAAWPYELRGQDIPFHLLPSFGI